MPKVSGGSGGEDGVQAVLLTMRILEFLAERRDPAGVTTLAEVLGTTKSRIFRHLRTLAQQGYVAQAADTERYRIGPQMVRLGRLVGEGLDLPTVAQPILRELRDALGHAVVVAQIEAEGVRVLARLPGKSTIEIQVKPGSLLPLHSSAQGKVALAFGEEELRTHVLRSRLDMHTPSTITRPAVLEEEIERTRQRGWAVAPNEAVIGLNALAAPVLEASGALAGTIAVVDSIQFIAAEPSEQQIRLTTAAAGRISEALGHRRR